jgi:hypothetical protein
MLYAENIEERERGGIEMRWVAAYIIPLLGHDRDYSIKSCATCETNDIKISNVRFLRLFPQSKQQ